MPDRINKVLRNVSLTIGEETVKSVDELILVGEPGIALEVLSTQLIEYGIPISRGDKMLLISAAKEMGIESDELDDILEI